MKSERLTAQTALAFSYTSVPNCLFQDKNVIQQLSKTPCYLAVYCVCKDMFQHSLHHQDKFTDNEGCIYFVLPYAKIAEQLQISEITVKRTMLALKKAGFIDSARHGFSNTYRLYLCSPLAAISICAELCGSTTDDTSNVSYDTLLTSNNKTSNNDSCSISKDTLHSHAAGVERSSKTTLFDMPPTSKAAKNAEKWFAARCTLLNNYNFMPAVETALRRFLTCLAETKKSADQISHSAWEIQLEKLLELSAYPDYQKEAIYAACGYRNLVSQVDRIKKKYKTFGPSPVTPQNMVDEAFETKEQREARLEAEQKEWTYF